MIVTRIHRWLPLTALLLLALPGRAAAQVDTSRTALPNIAPREVEIRGQLEISLPSLQRQPLIGFNPPPRVPRPPAGRQPFAETYKQSSADLPASPLRRPQPPSALGAAYPPARGLIESTVGRYFSRGVQGRLQAPLSRQASFLLQADYRGSDGFAPFADLPDVTTPFDALEGLAGVHTSGAQWAAGFTLSGFVESYDLFGAGPVTSGGLTPFLPQPKREGNGGTGTVSLSTLNSAPVEARLDLHYSATRYETILATEEPTPDERVERSEQRFGADADLVVPIPSGDLWIDGTASTASLADDQGSYAAVDAGGGLRLEVNNTLLLSLGARFLGAFSDTAQPRDGTTETLRIGYLSPDVRLEFLPVSGVRLYAHNRPGVEANAVADVFRTNPYIELQPELRPTLRSIDAEAGASLFVGPVQVAARGGFQRMPQYLFFEESASGVYSSGFSALRYGTAEIRHLGGSVSVVLPGGLHAMLGASYRDGRLPDEDTDIPYFAPVAGEATLSYSFQQSRGLIQLTGHYENKRYIDRARSRQVGAYLDLDVEASYRFTNLLSAVGRVENIGGNDNARWLQYPEPPVVIGIGMRVSW